MMETQHVARPRGRPAGSGKNAGRARKWIHEFLGAGDRPTEEIKRIVSEQPELGFSWRTLNAVKARFGIRSYKSNNGRGTGEWFWTFRTVEEVAEAKRQRSIELYDEAQRRWEKDWGEEIERAKDRDVKKFEASYADFERDREQVAASGQHRYEHVSLGQLIWDGQRLLETSKSIPDRQEKLERWRTMISEVESARRVRDEVSRARREANKVIDDLF